MMLNRERVSDKDLIPGRKIITHDGIFHADEVFAIALLRYCLGDIPVVRTRDITLAHTFHPECWLIDVGKVYDRATRCFDHHHMPVCSASNMLILNYLNEVGLVSNELRDELMDRFMVVSAIDTDGDKPFNGWQVNSLIRSFNYVEGGWELALKVATTVIQAAQNTVNEAANSKMIWQEGTAYCDGAIMSCHGFPIHWKRYDDGCIFMIEREKNEQYTYDPEYRLHSIDASKYPIQSGHDEIFLHQAKFFARYKSFNQALEAAKCSLVLGSLNNK